jgi:eukaryotic-like serine/threonine-protein kinase
MGQVYEARDPRLQRSIALKVMHVGKADERNNARLLREARLAAALQHPNVVVIHDVGEIQQPAALAGTTYVAMELVEGRSLREYVGDVGLSVKDRLRILRDVASALGAAHSRGMVHRDVKPENVMIRDDGAVKVLDFGIAKRAAAPGDDGPPSAPMMPTTAEGMTVGTPYYMAPEQMRGEELDGRADQFAWGVLAYELLAGELPWQTGIDSLQLVAQVLSRDPPLLSAKNPDVPTSVEAAVMRALAKSRELRFASMTDLLRAVDGDAAAWSPGTMRAPSSSGASLSSPSNRDIQLAATERSETPDRLLALRPRAVESGTMATAAPSPTPEESVHLPITRSRPLAIAVAATAGVAVIVATFVMLGSHPSTKPAAASAEVAPSAASATATAEPSAAPPAPPSMPTPSPVSAVAAVDASAPSPHPTSRRRAGSAPSPSPAPPSPGPAPTPAPTPTTNPYDHM